MADEGRFIAVSLRALANATEIEDRVLAAVRFASSSEDVETSRTEGHFGNPITMFRVELKKARDIKRFVERLDEWGIRAALAGQAEARMDEDRVFHFRLDKQQAYLARLTLASGKDVIDVGMKVGVYPASREGAVRSVAEWLDEVTSEQ